MYESVHDAQNINNTLYESFDLENAHYQPN
jgi:hypothetical protein